MLILIPELLRNNPDTLLEKYKSTGTTPWDTEAYSMCRMAGYKDPPEGTKGYCHCCRNLSLSSPDFNEKITPYFCKNCWWKKSVKDLVN
jgi:hypothetical protein